MMLYLWVAVRMLVLVLERGEGCKKLPTRFPIPPPLRCSDEESSAGAPAPVPLPLRSSSELLLLFAKLLPAATLCSNDRVRVLGMEPEVS